MALFIHLGQFSGHGTISAIGGLGHGHAGGGAGGRIGIHTWDYNHYKGELLAYGAGGTTGGDIGGPGTVFIEDKVGAFEYQSRYTHVRVITREIRVWFL